MLTDKVDYPPHKLIKSIFISQNSPNFLFFLLLTACEVVLSDSSQNNLLNFASKQV